MCTFLPRALNFRPRSAWECDDKSQMCYDFPVWPAQTYSLHLPSLVNYLLSLPLSIPWPCEKLCIINFIHIYFTLLCDHCFPYTVAACPCKRLLCVWLRMHVLCMGECVHFDAQFKVGWHYLFMPLLFLFPLRVKNSWRSILGRSRLTQMESIASQLNKTHACARTFRRSVNTCSILVVICRTLLSQSHTPSPLLVSVSLFIFIFI